MKFYVMVYIDWRRCYFFFNRLIIFFSTWFCCSRSSSTSSGSVLFLLFSDDESSVSFSVSRFGLFGFMMKKLQRKNRLRRREPEIFCPYMASIRRLKHLYICSIIGFIFLLNRHIILFQDKCYIQLCLSGVKLPVFNNRPRSAWKLKTKKIAHKMLFIKSILSLYLLFARISNGELIDSYHTDGIWLCDKAFCIGTYHGVGTRHGISLPEINLFSCLRL